MLYPTNLKPVVTSRPGCWHTADSVGKKRMRPKAPEGSKASHAADFGTEMIFPHPAK